MKQLLLLFCLLIVACNNKKEDPKPMGSVKISVEVNTDIPFLAVQIGTGTHKVSSINNWNISHRGIHDTIIVAQIGTPVFLRLWNADNGWLLKSIQGDSIITRRYSNFEPGDPYDPSVGYVPNTSSTSPHTQLYTGVIYDTIRIK